MYALLARQCGQLRLFISTPMEENRPWRPEWTGLDVVVQKGFTLRRTWKHPSGFDEGLAVHFPTDTFQQLARFKPDAVISAEMGFRTLMAYVYVRLHPKCRLLVWSEVTAVTERGRGNARQLLRRFLARRAHAFLAVGGAGVRYLESLGAPPGRVFQIAYSTDLKPFTSLPLERQAVASRRLLFSGQLIERKGLSAFVQALVRWAALHPQHSIEFSLVGDGPVREKLAAIPLPANMKLLFIGTLQYDQLPGIYANAGILVLPTLADTWAVVVNEALASGMPVLGSIYSQAVAELVEDGRNGWTFRPDLPEQVESALERALSVSELELNSMRACARQRALAVTPESIARVCADALRACGAR